MSKRSKKADPVVGAAQFPFRQNEEVLVEYDGSPYRGKVHRIAVNQQSCTVRYDVDGSMEPSVSPSRIKTSTAVVSPKLATIPEVKEAPPEEDGAATTEEVSQDEDDEPRFTSKRSVIVLNKWLKKTMKARLKRLKHEATWCCHLRHDEPPYFACALTEDDDGAFYSLHLSHGIVEMTRTCQCAGWSVKAVDEYLGMDGELLREAHRIVANNP